MWIMAELQPCAPRKANKWILLIQFHQLSQCRGSEGQGWSPLCHIPMPVAIPCCLDLPFPGSEALGSPGNALRSGSWSGWPQLQEIRCFQLSPMPDDNHESCIPAGLSYTRERRVFFLPASDDAAHACGHHQRGEGPGDLPYLFFPCGRWIM